MELKISLLGPFAAFLDGEPLAGFRSNKTQALLIYLAAEAALEQSRRAYSREQLMELLWPGLPQPSAQVNLRQTLYQLRQMIPAVDAANGDAPVPLVESDRNKIQLHPQALVDVDVADFLTNTGRHADANALAQAIVLYRSDFLSDFYLPDSETFEAWTAARREALRQLALDALERLAGHFLQRSEYGEAERYVRRQLEIDNLRESAHRQLMAVLAQSGRRRAALSHYETLCRLLETELSIAPSSATVELYEQIKDDKVTRWQEPALSLSKGDRVIEPHDVTSDARHRPPPHLVTPSPAHPVTPHNLPPQLTPFIGREAELGVLAQALADPGTRLITILGPGGIGKTRLALAAAEAQLNNVHSPPAFPHGIYFVGLARLDMADLLVPTIATALDFRFYEGGEPKEQLLGYLRRKAMLLVLDNFEHLLEGVGLIDEILATAPGMKLLVTSREKLNRQAEQLFPIGGLDLPEAETAAKDEVTGYSAVQLFLQSARRTRPDFALTAENYQEVLCICRLVEGMPLGIILGAAWLELLTPQEIVVEMSRDLDFLATEMGDVPERQRSLRAAFNHSWRLLSEREQAIFGQLSIFRGGCTREAAEAITSATLRDLQSLVNKSLLSRTPASRYLVHELLRQFAAEKLAQTPAEETAVHDRHSAYYCAFLYEHTENWHTGRQLETLAAVTHEADNARPALDWALAQREWQRLAQAIDSWAWYYDWHGRHPDGESFCQAIVEKAAAQDGGKTAVSADCLRLWAKALAWQGWFAADLSTTLHHLQQSLTLLERLELAGQDTRLEKAFTLFIQGSLLKDEGMDWQVGRLVLEQCLAIYRELDDQGGIAQSLTELAMVDPFAKDYPSALEKVQVALSIQQERGDQRQQAAVLMKLGGLKMDLGYLDEGEQLLREAMSLSQQIGDRASLVNRRSYLAEGFCYQGKYEEARQLARQNLAIYEELGHHYSEAFARTILCEPLIHSGEYQQARQQATDALRATGGVGVPMKEAYRHWMLGQLALVEESYIEAQAAFAESANFFEKVEPNKMGLALSGQGYTAYRLGQLPEAYRYLAQALSSGLAFRYYLPVVFTLPGVALFLAATGDAVRAVEVWALAKCHPCVAHSKWFEDVAGRELEALAASLPPEVAEAARERGRTLDLWETAAVLLEELQAAE